MKQRPQSYNLRELNSVNNLKEQERDPSPKPPENNAALLTADFSPAIPVLDFRLTELEHKT